MRWLIVALLIANLAVYAWLEHSRSKTDAINQRNINKSGSDFPLVMLLDEVVSNKLLQRQMQGSFADLTNINPVSGPNIKNNTPIESHSQALKSSTMCWFVSVDPTVVVNSLASASSSSVAEQALLTISHWLSSKNVDARLIDGKTSVFKGYLIYLAVVAAPDKSSVLLKQLTEGGYDAFMIKSGALQGAVSLGMYKSKHGAELAAQRFLQQGYAAKVTAYYQQKLIKQLQAVSTSSSDTLFVSTAWQLKQNNFLDLLIDKKPCQSVAHHSNLE